MCDKSPDFLSHAARKWCYLVMAKGLLNSSRAVQGRIARGVNAEVLHGPRLKYSLEDRKNTVNERRRARHFRTYQRHGF
jgi:hypothetical protein